MDVEGSAGGPDDGVDDRAAHELVDPAPAGSSHDQLGGVFGPGHLDQGRRHLGPDHLDETSTQVVEQRSVLDQALEPAPVRLSSVRTCTPTSSALVRIAIRAARRMRTALPREPVSETTTRSLVSQGPAML